MKNKTLGIQLSPEKQLKLRNALAVLLLSASTKTLIEQADPKAYLQACDAMQDTFVAPVFSLNDYDGAKDLQAYLDNKNLD